MKTKLLFISMFWISMICFSQNTNVPDDNFENYLETHNAFGATVALGDASSMGNGIANDDTVLTANVNTVTFLNVQGMNISDLTGIEDFTALNYLECFNNNLSSLEVSQNNLLEVLVCFNNNLSTLDVSQNTVLGGIICSNNNLSTLDISQNTALQGLDCSDNNLTSLDVSNNLLLDGLYCVSNNLSTLDISQNTALTSLDCRFNNLSALDVSQNTALTRLFCSGTNLSTLDISQNTALTLLYCSSNNLSSLDVSQHIALTSLRCESNNLSSLNVKNGNNVNFVEFNAETNPNLTCIDVDDVAYSVANWTNIDPQTSFSEDCSTMSVEDFSLSGFKMYPNPVNELLTISLNSDANYSLMNVNGQVIKKGNITNKETTIDVSSLSSGIYFLKVKTDEGVATKKLIKQ